MFQVVSVSTLERTKTMQEPKVGAPPDELGDEVVVVGQSHLGPEDHACQSCFSSFRVLFFFDVHLVGNDWLPGRTDGSVPLPLGCDKVEIFRVILLCKRKTKKKQQRSTRLLT